MDQTLPSSNRRNNSLINCCKIWSWDVEGSSKKGDRGIVVASSLDVKRSMVGKGARKQPGDRERPKGVKLSCMEKKEASSRCR